MQMPSENSILAMQSACENPENGSEEAILASSTLVSAAEESDNDHEEAVLAIPALDSAAEEADYCNEAVSVSPALISAAEELGNVIQEAKLTSNALDPMSEESTHRIVDELSYNSKVEIRSITFDFDTSVPMASGKEKCPCNGGSEHLGTQDSSRLDDPNTEPVSSQLQYVNGESSFSAAGPVSGLISYSGPIAYSGSVSLRSDSSTTSTRSFAFPV